MMYQYNPYFQQQFQQQSSLPAYDINWVQGEVEAKAFQMPRNSKTILMDSEDVDTELKKAERYWLSKEATNYDMSEIIAEQNSKHDKYEKMLDGICLR